MNIIKSYPRYRNQKWFFASLILLSIIALYTPYLNRTMQYDETYTLLQYAVSPLQALFAYTTPNNHLLHSLAVWLMTTFGGTHAIIVRFPAFASALLSLVLMFRIGWRIGGYRVGLVTTLLMAATSQFADYAVNARGYSLQILLTLLLFYQIFFSHPRTRSFYRRILLICGLMVITLPSSFLVIFSAVSWSIWQIRRNHRRFYRQLILPLLVGLCAGALFYLPAYALGFTENLSQFGHTTPQGLVQGWLDMMFGTPVIGLLILLGSVPGWIFLFRQQQPLFLWTLLLLVMAGSLALVQWLITGTLLFPRNYLYLLPFVALVAALGWQQILRNNWLLVLIPLILLICIGVLPNLGKGTPVDDLLVAIQDHATAQDLLLIGCCLDEPTFYHISRQGKESLFELTDNTERIVMIPTRNTPLQELAIRYQAIDVEDQCLSEAWGDFQVTICPVDESIRAKNP